MTEDTRYTQLRSSTIHNMANMNLRVNGRRLNFSSLASSADTEDEHLAPDIEEMDDNVFSPDVDRDGDDDMDNEDDDIGDEHGSRNEAVGRTKYGFLSLSSIAKGGITPRDTPLRSAPAVLNPTLHSDIPPLLSMSRGDLRHLPLDLRQKQQQEGHPYLSVGSDGELGSPSGGTMTAGVGAGRRQPRRVFTNSRERCVTSTEN